LIHCSHQRAQFATPPTCHQKETWRNKCELVTLSLTSTFLVKDKNVGANMLQHVYAAFYIGDFVNS
jgi:hypothetical protein